MVANINVIWEEIRSGNQKAWRQLVRLYSSLVFTVARRAGLSEPDAEDCAQHTWMALYRRRHAIKDPVALPAWLIKTTHRQAVLMARQFQRQTDSGDLSQQADPSPLPDELVESLINQSAIHAALPHLDSKCRQLIASLYFSKSKVSYRKLAADLKVKPNSLGPLRSRCLGKLKKILEKMGYESD